MINDAVAHALRIDGYIERYGLETVEHLMDIGFCARPSYRPHQGVIRSSTAAPVVEKGALTPALRRSFANFQPSVTYEVVGERIPPHPEHDLLWFLSTYAPP